MTGAVVGYGRTSSAEQRAGLEAQIAELEAAGATKVFQEHVSSVDAQAVAPYVVLNFLKHIEQEVEGSSIHMPKEDSFIPPVPPTHWNRSTTGQK